MCTFQVMVNRAPSSASHVSRDTVGTKIPIIPDGDGFDHHTLVVKEIAHIIRSQLEEGKPSWKQLSGNHRDDFFDSFMKKFTWQPEHKVKVRKNFEIRGSAKMSQLMQEVRKNLEDKPSWMGDDVWNDLKQYWKSSTFKKKSQTNKRNRNSMAGASLHTGGSIPHRLHWNKMKKEKGAEPSLTEFYFRTHRKKDQSWVGVHAESAYDKFEQKKMDLSTQNTTFGLGEDEVDSQPTYEMPTDLDIWVDSVGRKKGRIFGLGSYSKTLIPSSNQQTNTHANSEEVEFLRSQVHALNASLQRQEQEKLQMRQQMQRQEKEMSKTNKKLAAIMKHLGFVGSSSHVSNPNSESNEHIDEEDNNDFAEDVDEDNHDFAEDVDEEDNNVDEDDHDFAEDVDEDNSSYHIDN